MFQQLLEELSKMIEEVTKQINEGRKLQQEVSRLNDENKALKEEIANHECKVCDHNALEQEIADLKQQIADHVCPTCNHEEEIEVLKAQVISIQVEKEEQAKQYEENVLALQAEIDALKKILATD